jgi:hypothetical protein
LRVWSHEQSNEIFAGSAGTSGADADLLKQREAMYEAARLRNPQRWSGKTRSWDPVTDVWLDPPKENQAKERQDLKAT